MIPDTLIKMAVLLIQKGDLGLALSLLLHAAALLTQEQFLTLTTALAAAAKVTPWGLVQQATDPASRLTPFGTPAPAIDPNSRLTPWGTPAQATDPNSRLTPWGTPS